MSHKVWLSTVGRPVDPAEATVSVFDRGFLYGDSVYETLRTAGGRLVAWNEHVERLHQSATGIALELPFEEAGMRAAVDATLRASGNADSRVRIVVTRGTGPMALDVRTSSAPVLVVYVEPLTLPEEAAYERGISAVVVERGDSRFAGLKTGNYLPNILALRRAIAAQGDDAIMCNMDGLVAEGATSNLFAVDGGEVITPSLAAGLLEGITRRHVMRCAGAIGHRVAERDITPAQLRQAQEVFLTSSIRGVMPVTRLDGVPVGEGREGELCRAIRKAYDAWLAEIARGPEPA